jgi:hypothetical protein
MDRIKRQKIHASVNRICEIQSEEINLLRAENQLLKRMIAMLEEENKKKNKD